MLSILVVNKINFLATLRLFFIRADNINLIRGHSALTSHGQDTSPNRLLHRWFLLLPWGSHVTSCRVLLTRLFASFHRLVDLMVSRTILSLYSAAFEVLLSKIITFICDVLPKFPITLVP